ncbi:MAG: carboxypeptidase regulatory-like domain-containing protein [Ignavibacteriales bacterium]|nr:carboxypeptidase regulatory-like domain-containing protein [Ignavibacteriales bacterium]
MLLVIFMMTTLSVFAQLQPPADLTATEGGSHHGKYVKLEWTYAAPSPNSFIRFKVYKKLADSTVFILAASNLKDKRFSDTRVAPGATYQYYVVAYNNGGVSDPSNTVEITLAPPPPPPVYAKITGTVVDASGQPLKDAFVKAFSQTSPYVRSAKTNSAGFFSMTVQTGTYFVQTSKFGYFFEYYDNVATLEAATPVVVNEGDSLSLAIDLSTFVPPASFTLTGNVTNDLGAAQRAEIYVYKVRANNYHYMVKRTHTDSLGNYSVNVKENDTVIVYAKAPGFAYFPEFYNNKRVIADADKVAITGNVTGIDFVMDPLPVYANGISGVVADTLGAPVMGYVSAYRVEGTSFGKNHTLSTPIHWVFIHLQT